MAYDHGKQQITMVLVTGTTAGATLDLSATGRKARYVPLMQTVIHAIGVVTVGSAAKGGVLKFTTRATAGSSVTAGTLISTITIASGTGSGKIVARKIRSTVSEGGVVGCYVSTTATGVKVAAMLWVEAQPQDFANNTKITLVTT